MDILDWLQYFHSMDNPSALAGERADLSRFVYRDSQLAENQFVLSRFVISCCAADAFAVGMVVEWPGASGLSSDEWVAVQGTIFVVGSGENQSLEIQADMVDPIPPPNQPYLFP